MSSTTSTSTPSSAPSTSKPKSKSKSKPRSNNSRNKRQNTPRPVPIPTSTATTTTTGGPPPVVQHPPFQPLAIRKRPAPTATTMRTVRGATQTTREPAKAIHYTNAYHARLRQLVHGPEMLKAEGYRMEGFGEEEISGLRRCRNCHARLRTKKKENVKNGKRKTKKKIMDMQREQGKNPDESEVDEGDGGAEGSTGEQEQEEQIVAVESEAVTATTKNDADEDKDDGGVQVNVTVREVTTTTMNQKMETGEKTRTAEKAEDNKHKGQKAGKRKGKKKKTAICQFHIGRVMNKHFTCCQKHVSEPGCVGMDAHTVTEYAPGELESNWTLHATPAWTKRGDDIREAVALDCEMGTSAHGDSELIRLSLVDYFTGEILIDSLVYPRVPMQHLNTRYSGVTRGMLETARRRKQCILGGREAARKRVWRYVGRETTVVVHGGTNDFLALRWIHGCVIDTYVVEGERRSIPSHNNNSDSNEATKDKEGEAVAGGIGGRSLKHLADKILGQQIQVGNGGHDSVEDAMACRELVDWYVREGL